MNTLKKAIKHFTVIIKHKKEVFRLCLRCGLVWQGIVHDLSKFSPVEFFEGVKYFQGHRSPIKACKEENGLSKAWLHHKGRNKHHFEYWIDSLDKGGAALIMPYKYALEMVCDSMAAGIVYQGENWTKEYELSYWNAYKDTALIHPKTSKFLTEVYTEIAEQGMDKIITKEYLTKKYEKIVEGK